MYQAMTSIIKAYIIMKWVLAQALLRVSLFITLS